MLHLQLKSAHRRHIGMEMSSEKDGHAHFSRQLDRSRLRPCRQESHSSPGGSSSRLLPRRSAAGLSPRAELSSKLAIGGLRQASNGGAALC